MRRWAAALALAAALAVGSPARAQAADPDPWLGQDKALHFGASAVIASGTYALGGLWQPSSETKRLLLGGSVALGAGVAKELYDLISRRGSPSWRDLAWDVAGTAVGLAVAWVVDRFVVQPLAAPSSSRGAGLAAQPGWVRVAWNGTFVF